MAEASEDVVASVKTVEADEPLSWLYALAQRRLVDAERRALRERRARASLEELWSGTLVAGPHDRVTSRRELVNAAGALAALPRVDRQLLVLAAFELPYVRIGQVCAMSPDQVTWRVFQARRRLKRLLGAGFECQTLPPPLTSVVVLDAQYSPRGYVGIDQLHPDVAGPVCATVYADAGCSRLAGWLVDEVGLVHRQPTPHAVDSGCISRRALGSRK